MAIEKSPSTIMDMMGIREQETKTQKEESDADILIKAISGFSLQKSAGESGLTPYPMREGSSDYSHWSAELRRMSPEIEETLTSIWRIGNIWNPIELAQAKFESQMCHEEIFAWCHQRTRQKRFLVRRKMLAEEAVTCWLTTHQPWHVPEELWDDLHMMDPGFQNAVMDISHVHNDNTAWKAFEIWEDAVEQIEAIDTSIRRDQKLRVYKDYSQVIDALLNTDPNNQLAIYDAIKKNTDAYW